MHETRTPATLLKRQQLEAYIQHEVTQVDAVQAIIVIGSVCTGNARPDSDIDGIVFLDPFDEYGVPAEAIWRPEDNTYHSSFAGVKGVAVDFTRLDLAQWRDPTFSWPEPRRAELSSGWIAFDRGDTIVQLIAERTEYDDGTRQARLDEAIIWLDQHLGWNQPPRVWENLGPLIAHDRLSAAYFYLVQALFAINRRWRTWRNREMSAVLALPWLPQEFELRVLQATMAADPDHAAYQARVEAMDSLFHAVLAKVQADGDYGREPIKEAFIRLNEEPGRAWNMADWEHQRRERYG